MVSRFQGRLIQKDQRRSLGRENLGRTREIHCFLKATTMTASVGLVLCCGVFLNAPCSGVGCLHAVSYLHDLGGKT